MPRPLHITQVVHDFHPVVGGIETYAFNLAKGLVDAGHTVKVFTTQLPNTPSTENYHGIQIRRFRAIARPFNYPVLPGLLPALLRDRVDIFHAHINSPLTVDIAATASQLTHIPLVITYHADALMGDIAGKPPFFRIWMDQMYQRARQRAADIAQQLIVTSPMYRNSSLFLQDYLHKITVIPATINPYFLTSKLTVNQAKESFGFHLTDLLLLFVGRLVPYKGLETLIHTFHRIHQQHPATRLAIVGSGPLNSSLSQLSMDLGLDTAVHFLGVLPRRRLRDIYTACDIFVLPSRSRSEAFGIVQLEAMAQEKPVVTTSVGGVPYVVKNKTTGLVVPPQDSKALEQALLRLITNSALRKTFGRAGRKRVLDQFTRKPTTQQLETVYYKL
ncbi:MAG: glycosyltransferase family 4 protein, partial [Promethearchaeota archaeon]